jgi:uncharacterized protein
MTSCSTLEVNRELVLYQLLHLKQIVFEVTDACNLRCKYCAYSDFYGGYDERKNSYFPFEKAQLIIDYLVNLWKENTSPVIIEPLTVSFYGGEPLMNINFIKKVVDYLQHKDLNKRLFLNYLCKSL